MASIRRSLAPCALSINNGLIRPKQLDLTYVLGTSWISDMLCLKDKKSLISEESKEEMLCHASVRVTAGLGFMAPFPFR